MTDISFESLWSLYFFDEEYNINDIKLSISKLLSEFFMNNFTTFININIFKLYNYISLDYNLLKDNLPISDFEVVLIIFILEFI